METASPLIATTVFALTWSAAILDMLQRRIPNKLVFTAAIVGSIVQLTLLGASGLLIALSGMAVGLAVLMPGYLMGTTGAGDVKLMAAIGIFLGPYNVLLAGFASIATGGVIALVFMALSFFSTGSQAPWQRYGLMLKTLFATGRPIYLTPVEGEVMGRKFPFAVSIAVGTTLFLIWQSPLLRQIN